MATSKKSFILYADIKTTVDKLDNEYAGKLFKHILAYVNDENPETDDLLLEIAFEPIKRQFKRDLQKWEQIKSKRSDAGKASAESRKQKATKSTSVKSVQQTSTNPTVNVNVNDNVNVNVINNKTHIPSLQEFLNHGNTKLAYQNKDAQYYNHALTSKYNTWLDDDWKNAHGKKIKNWRNALNNTLPYLKPIYPDKKSIPFTTKKHIPKAPEPRKKVAVTIDDLTSGNLAEQKRAWEQKIKESNNNQSKRVSRAEALRQAHNS